MLSIISIWYIIIITTFHKTGLELIFLPLDAFVVAQSVKNFHEDQQMPENL